jgi:hypothetical protein
MPFCFLMDGAVWTVREGASRIKGLVEPEAINAQCGEFARAGISTSTYGLGRHFNEDLMDPFHEEFELLNALCARRLRLEVMSSRLAVQDEMDAYSAQPGPSYLRRKVRQGKGSEPTRLGRALCLGSRDAWVLLVSYLDQSYAQCESLIRIWHQ